MRIPLMILIASLCVTFLGCDRKEEGAATQPGPTPASRPVDPPAPPSTQGATRVVFLGDSLTAGFGVEADQAYPALLQQMMLQVRPDVQMINAGVSGDTTAGGLARVDWILKQHKPQIVVVGLGGNDGLRAQSVENSEKNLREIVQRSQNFGAKVLLLGMLIPPNYGSDYTGKFKEIYPRIAKELNVSLVPFLLEGVGGDARFNQADGIHPTAEGHRIIASNLFPQLRKLVEEVASGSSSPATAPVTGLK